MRMMKKVIKKVNAAILALCLTLCLPFLARAQTVQVLLGDVDGDGAVTSADSRLALRLSVGLEPSNPDAVRVADVDKNSKIEAADARMILRVSVGLDELSGEFVEITVVDIPQQPNDVRDTSIFALPVPAAPVVSAPSGTFSITVYGNGHGVGMSQWGAVIMAEAGYTYEEILACFYKGSYVEHDPTCPATVIYNGSQYSTEEIVARITSMEIGGIATDDDALKAQAIAIYTQFKLNNYKGNSNNIGVASSSYSNCSDRLKAAVHSVLGQYVTLASDPYRAPVLTVYSALNAGRSMDCSYTWGGSYPVSASSPFEYKLAAQTIVYRFLDSGVQTEIVDGFGNVVYVRDASGRVVQDTRTSYQGEYFAEVLVLPCETIRQKILAYNSGIVLDADPANWISILEHNAAIDANRGYVKSVRVGNIMLNGVGKFSSALGLRLRSDCFTVAYNR